MEYLMIFYWQDFLLKRGRILSNLKSFKNCIKFHLDIKEKNIIFLDFFNKRTRFKPPILHYFYKFTPQARAIVKTVTMDLNCYYPIVARQFFPNAKIVIDCFHMVQMLTRSFNSLRVQTMKQFNKQSREYKLLKSP